MQYKKILFPLNDNFFCLFLSHTCCAQGILLTLHQKLLLARLGVHTKCWGSNPGLLYGRQMTSLL